MLGWEMEDQALGGKKEKDVRAGNCWQKKKKGERRGEKEGVREWSEQKM